MMPAVITLLFVQVTHAAEDSILVTAGYDQSLKLWDLKARSTDALQVMKVFKVGSPVFTSCS
jgi:hypothetical protein